MPQSYKVSNATNPSEVVVDLSDHVDRLMAFDDISDALTEEQENRLVQYVKSCLEMSHRQISRRYDSWHEADLAHDVYVPPDTTEFREKAVIPDTRAISDTVLTYMMAAITGRNPMFQLEGQDRKSRSAALYLERILHQQMRRTAGEARMAQLCLDSIRYGFAPTKLIWDAASNHNTIINFNPRRAYPDPRVNWSEFQDGSFFGFSDTASFSALVRSGLYPKLTKYPALRQRFGNNQGSWNAHHFAHLNDDKGYHAKQNDTATEFYQVNDSRVVDEIWLNLQGWQINVPSIRHIYLIVTIIDEAVVIRCQANPYGQQYPIVTGALYQDVHKTFGQSLYDILLPLHDIATWLLRSRVDNVQAALNNLIFVDPTQVAVSDLIDRNPWGIVRMLPGGRIEEGLHIANIPDVTRGHWQDILALSDLKQRASAASDAQQGMPTADVRTATEIQRLTQLGSQRLGVISRIMSANTVRPMVRMMVQNIQDALEFSGSVRVDQDNMPTQLAAMVQDGYLDFNVTKDLQGAIDYLIIDGTLPIEPTRNAQTWIDMLSVLHQTGLLMEYNVGRIAEEAIRSMGVSDLDRFRISQEERQANGLSPSQQLAVLEKMRGVSTEAGGAGSRSSASGRSVQPAEQVLRQVERGNLIPMRSAA